MTITTLPAAPSRADPTNFATKADAFLGALAGFVTETNATGVDVTAKSVTATQQATLATQQVGLATAQQVIATDKAVLTAQDRVQTGQDRTATGTSAAAAEVSRIAASKLNLGNKSSAPTLDNQGAALLAGATYYDTSLNSWRVWSGSAWIEGISAVAGVSSLNGLTGTVTGIATTANITSERTAIASLTNKTITEIVFAVTGTTPAFLATNGAVQTWTLTGASTPTNSLTSGQSIILIITPGSFAITWPSVIWTKIGGSGALPTLFTAGKTTVVLWQVGSNLYGSHLGDTV